MSRLKAVMILIFGVHLGTGRETGKDIVSWTFRYKGRYYSISAFTGESHE